MLIEFNFANYRSFREPTVLSMEATGLGSLKSCLIYHGNKKIVPCAAIYGKKRWRQKQCHSRILVCHTVYKKH